MKDLIRRLIGFFIVLLATHPSFADAGIWSTQATNLSYCLGTLEQPGIRTIAISSPDPRKRVTVHDVEFFVEVDGRLSNGTVEEGIETLAELGWAPDSQAFFITQSDGGAVGSWFVRVYILKHGKVVNVDIMKKAIEDFMHRYDCDVWGEHEGNETPNIAALQWLNGSKELLLLAEVPPHSSCPEMGKFTGYAVAVPSGKILHRYSAKEVKDRWGKSLGLRHSNDEEYDTDKDRLLPWK